jgi:hypothetical protein
MFGELIVQALKFGLLLGITIIFLSLFGSVLQLVTNVSVGGALSDCVKLIGAFLPFNPSAFAVLLSCFGVICAYLTGKLVWWVSKEVIGWS